LASVGEAWTPARDTLRDMESTWDTQDVPVLEAAIRYAEEHGAPPGATGAQIAEMTGLSVEDVGRALSRLDGEYLEIGGGLGPGPSRWRADRIYPAARRAVGQWPTPESWADRLIKALNEAADAEKDEAKKGKLRHAAEAVGDLGRGVLSDVIAAVIVRSTGMG